MNTILSTAMASYGVLVGVIRSPLPWRTLILPEVPWLMPSAFIRRHASMMACRLSFSFPVIAADHVASQAPKHRQMREPMMQLRGQGPAAQPAVNPLAERG